MDLILEINGKAIKVAIRGEGAFETNDSPAIHFDIVLVVLDLCAVPESVPPPIKRVHTLKHYCSNMGKKRSSENLEIQKYSNLDVEPNTIFEQVTSICGESAVSKDCLQMVS